MVIATATKQYYDNNVMTGTPVCLCLLQLPLLLLLMLLVALLLLLLLAATGAAATAIVATAAAQIIIIALVGTVHQGLVHTYFMSLLWKQTHCSFMH